jgi:hypothetical protein
MNRSRVDAELMYGSILERTMLSIEISRRATPRAVMLAAAAAAQLAHSQALLESAAADTSGHLTAAILEAQSEDGPHAKQLIELFTALGLEYLESGNHVLAVAAIDQAQTVVRANYGLRSLEQVSLLRQRIIAEEARRNFKEAWQLEKELLDLARANPGDRRAAEVFREIGDKRMQVLERYLVGEYPPQVILGCYYTRLYRLPDQPDRSCTAGSRRAAARAILEDAQLQYGEAIEVLARGEPVPNDELRELELALITSSYRYGVYRTGRNSIARLIAYEAAQSQAPLSRAAAQLQLADWDLLFEQSQQALHGYERVYASLAAEVPETALDELFSPEVPVVLPTFLPTALHSEEAQSTGFVDVAFEITRLGASRRIEILAKTNASTVAAQRLTKLIERTRFRPRVTEGEFARASRVVVRYFVKE